VRVVELSTTVTQEALDVFTDGLGDLDIGTRKKYCIDYTQGSHASKMICIVVEDSFQDVCDDSASFGLPLLTCTNEGCDCVNTATPPEVDALSTYFGFVAFDFSSCYGTSNVENDGGSTPEVSSRGTVVDGLTNGTKSASVSANTLLALLSMAWFVVIAI